MQQKRSRSRSRGVRRAPAGRTQSPPPAKPGKSRSALETPRGAQGVKAVLPVLTIRGARPGRLAVIMAAQHGREVNGIAAIERAFHRIDENKLSGTVVFLPVMNPVGVRTRRQDYPVEEGRYRGGRLGLTAGYNMHATWGGAGGDTYGRQVAAAVWDTYLRHADVALDLHAWSGLSLCLAWGHRKYRKLVRSFGLPWHLIRDDMSGEGGTPLAVAFKAGIPLLVAELVGQNTICRQSVRFGERGILNTLICGGLLTGAMDLPPVQYEFDQDHVETAARTPVEGLCVTDFVKGDLVKRGQTVARVISLDTLETLWEFKAPHNGLLFYVGGAIWGEDHTEHSVLFPGQLAVLLKKVSRVIRN